MTRPTLPAYMVRPATARLSRPRRPDLAPSPQPEPTPAGQAAIATRADRAAPTRSPVRLASSSADLAPPPMRPGAEACLVLPSRIGDRLHHRDGRVTDLQGRPLRSAG